jgi:hypothetical protein
MLPLVGGFAAKGIGRLGRGLLDDVPTSMFDVDPTMPRKLMPAQMADGAPGAGVPPKTLPTDEASRIPTTKGIEAAEDAYRGGVADFGDPEAARLIQGMPGYFDYRGALADSLRAQHGDTMKVYRSMTEDQLAAWRNGDDMSPMGFTTRKEVADKWGNLAQARGQKRVVVEADMPTDSVVMRGHEGEGEFVFDPNQVDASSVALPTDEASRMARAREMGLGTDAYHATQSDFTSFKSPDDNFMLDRMLGTHFAVDPRASNNLLEHGTTGKTMGDGARVIPARLPDDAKFLTVEQKPLSWAGNVENRKPWQAIESDQGVIERMVMSEAYRKDPKMLARYLVEARAVPEKDAGGFARRLIAGETISLPVDGPVNGIDAFLRDIGGKPYNAADRKRAVELAQESWANQGYSGLKYTNTSPMETKGISDATSYIVFDPKNIRSRFAKFDPAKAGSADILAGLGVVGAGAALSQQDGFDYGALSNVVEGSNGQRSN